jgi:AI-2 transport protein TqsA
MVTAEQRVQTICLLILTAIGIGAALYFLRPVLIPFVLAIFLVHCLAPVIDVQTRHLPIGRPVAVINTLLIGCIVLVLGWSVVWTSVSEFSAGAQDYESQFEGLAETVAGWLPLEAMGIDDAELEELMRFPREQVRTIVGSLILSIRGVLETGLLVAIFMIFMIAGSSTRAPVTEGLWAEIEHRVRRYIVTKMIVSAVTGIIVAVVLMLLGVPFAFVFGVLAFMLNFIPSIGSFIATLLPLPVVLLSTDLSVAAKVMAIVIPGAVQFSVGNIIEPKVMGGSLGLHPVVILLGLIFFGMIWGIIGMILATPIVAVVKIILDRVTITAPMGELLAGRLRPKTVSSAP